MNLKYGQGYSVKSRYERIKINNTIMLICVEHKQDYLASLNAFKFIASFFYLGQEPDKSDIDSRLSGFEYLSALKDKSKVRGDF